MIKLKKICVHKYELLHVKLLGLRMTSCNNKELKILPEKFSKMPFPQEFYYYIMKNM